MRARLVAASRGLFFVWLVTSAFALLSALPTAMALAPTAAAPSVSLPESIVEASKALSALGVVTLSTLFLVAAIGPLLQQTWIASFDGSRSFTDALADGSRRYVSAVAVSLWLLPGLAIALAATLGLPLAVLVGLDGQVSDRAVDIFSLCAALPGAVLLAVWATWHDLARAAVATDVTRARDAVRRALRALSTGALAAYVVFFAMGAATWVLTQAVGIDLHGVVAMLAGQVLILLRLAARGSWLASAHARVR